MLQSAGKPLDSISFSNVGLQQSAIDGSNAERHLRRVVDHASQLLTSGMLVVFLCELGDNEHGPGQEFHQAFETSLNNTFNGPPLQFHWKGELLCVAQRSVPLTVSVMWAGCQVPSQKWRYVQVVDLHFKHWPIKVYHAHLSSSAKRNLTDRTRTEVFCTIAADAHRCPTKRGYIIGGDFNSNVPFLTALFNGEKKSVFFRDGSPKLVFPTTASKQRHHGDVAVCWGIDIACRDNAEAIKADSGHDTVIVSWPYMERHQDNLNPLPASQRYKTFDAPECDNATLTTTPWVRHSSDKLATPQWHEPPAAKDARTQSNVLSKRESTENDAPKRDAPISIKYEGAALPAQSTEQVLASDRCLSDQTLTPAASRAQQSRHPKQVEDYAAGRGWQTAYTEPRYKTTDAPERGDATLSSDRLVSSQCLEPPAAKDARTQPSVPSKRESTEDDACPEDGHSRWSSDASEVDRVEKTTKRSGSTQMQQACAEDGHSRWFVDAPERDKVDETTKRSGNTQRQQACAEDGHLRWSVDAPEHDSAEDAMYEKATPKQEELWSASMCVITLLKCMLPDLKMDSSEIERASMLLPDTVLCAGEAIKEVCIDLFWRRASSNDHVLEISNATIDFAELFRVRRIIKRNDNVELSYNETCYCWQLMYDDFCRTLTPEQALRPTRRKRSCFNAYMHRRFGNKRFVMAIWQTGTAWLPVGHNPHPNAVVKALAQWCIRFRRAQNEYLYRCNSYGTQAQAMPFRMQW